MRRKTNAALMLVLAFALIASSCAGGGTGEYDLVAEGTLTVCSEVPYRPMEFEEGGVYVGFDVDLMQAIADELGLEMEFINTGFDAITTGSAMQGGQCDIAASSITILPEREENIDFSDGYFDAEQSLLVKKDSGITSLSDFSGRTLGVQSVTTGAMYAEENAPADTEIVAFDAGGDLFVAMEAGQIEGILQDLVVNGDRLVDDDTVTIVETYPTDEVYGLAVQEEGKESLLEAVNDALQTLRDNGTYDTIFAKWFG